MFFVYWCTKAKFIIFGIKRVLEIFFFLVIRSINNNLGILLFIISIELCIWWCYSGIHSPDLRPGVFAWSGIDSYFLLCSYSCSCKETILLDLICCFLFKSILDLIATQSLVGCKIQVFSCFSFLLLLVISIIDLFVVFIILDMILVVFFNCPKY